MKNLLALVFIILILTSNVSFASADCTCLGSATLIGSNDSFVTLSIDQELSCVGYACGIKKNDEVKIYFSADAPRFNYVEPTAKTLTSKEVGEIILFKYILQGSFGAVNYRWEFR
jgi:hypothetical protein